MLGFHHAVYKSSSNSPANYKNNCKRCYEKGRRARGKDEGKIAAMETKRVLHMTGGDGATSYAKNSCFQEVSLQFLQPLLEECIQEMSVTSCDIFRIADLGCSAGPNTLFVIERIANLVQEKYANSPLSSIPCLQAFFSDLPSNDFNFLFNSLWKLANGNDHPHASSYKKVPLQDERFFAAGVAGSFHGRLFPKNYLHFIHSSYSLHWLSKVPTEIEDKTSNSWNRDHVYISKTGPLEVAAAYQNQFRKDMNTFLAARSFEMVRGGCMFIYLSGRQATNVRDQGASGIIGDILNESLDDMVVERLLDEEKKQSFNLPFFAPCIEEVMDEVQIEGSFRVKRAEFLRGVVQEVNKQYNQNEITESDPKEPSFFGMMLARQFRAILEGIIASHFGKNVMNLLFEKFAINATRHTSQLLASNAQEGGVLLVLEKK